MLHWCLFLSLVSAGFAETKVGDFENYAHGIGGEVFIKDEKTLLIKGFTYDGAGPDAFFWVGKSQAPSGVGTILPYPFEGKFYDYEDKEAPILDRRFNGEDIELTLPDNLKTSDLKWISVWCRQFGVNFGDMFFSVENATDHVDEDHHDMDHDDDDGLPPPLIEPDNSHDAKHPGWKEDSDVYSEAEAEDDHGHAHAEGSASRMAISFSVILLLIPHV